VVRREAVEPFYHRLAAAGLGAPDANRLSDVVSCPALKLPARGDPVTGLGRALTSI